MAWRTIQGADSLHGGGLLCLMPGFRVGHRCRETATGALKLARPCHTPPRPLPLAACKRLKAKLVVAKLDRLARNVHFVSGLMESGVDFVAADQPFANRLTVHILAAVAEHEREAISQRTKLALAAAKARGKKLGGPKLNEARLIGHEANRRNADRFAANVRPIVEEIKRSGVTSLRGVAAVLAARGVPTARGGTWSAAQIANIMRR